MVGRGSGTRGDGGLTASGRVSVRVSGVDWVTATDSRGDSVVCEAVIADSAVGASPSTKFAAFGLEKKIPVTTNHIMTFPNALEIVGHGLADSRVNKVFPNPQMSLAAALPTTTTEANVTATALNSGTGPQSAAASVAPTSNK